MSKTFVYRVIFVEDDEIYEIFAKHVAESEMFGFIIVEDMLFGEKSTVVVDPSEELLKARFSGVRKTFIPMHSVIRIDEVESEGAVKICKKGKNGDNVRHFPANIYTSLENNNNRDTDK